MSEGEVNVTFTIDDVTYESSVVVFLNIQTKLPFSKLFDTDGKTSGKKTESCYCGQSFHPPKLVCVA